MPTDHDYAVSAKMSDDKAASAASTLVDSLAAELARRWRKGERACVEDFLALHPELCQNPEAVAELIYEELCLRQESGQYDAAEEILRRFPQWQSELKVLIQCHEFLEPGPAPVGMPTAGEKWGDFHLLAELGRGAYGRVFLATQTALADRPVVLKLAARTGQEHISLARLQHTHIVPLYSVEEDRALRGLCMPYFGGASLARILEKLRARPREGLQGRHVLEVVRAAQGTAALKIPVDGAACRFLAQVSYARAICWMGICLADALQYTHERGLVHLDIKPANVLWAADGQPMLLDLHLAGAPIAAGTSAPPRLGGTPAYMAPEQRRAMAAVSAGQAVPEAVDGRADIYGLGLVLAEALYGALPPRRQREKWLRQRSAHVTVGLADILAKCLADDPAQRYASAGALAEDLRRHLADRTLRGVPNRSLAERYRKWRRRRPYQPALVALVLTILTGVGLAAAYVMREGRKARAAWTEGAAHLQRGDIAAARQASRRGLAIAEGLPFHQYLADDLHAQLREADRADAVRDLHGLAEQLRACYGADDRPGPEAVALEAHCRSFWECRARILAWLAAQPGSDQVQVKTDLLDMAILWTDLRVRLAGDDKQVHAMALETLAQAEALFGSSSVLVCARRAHGHASGGETVAVTSVLPPRTAWEHFAVARAHQKMGQLDEAASHFDQSLGLDPKGFWPNFLAGKCAYQRARFEDAVLAFTACTALAPEKACCFYNRGLAYDALRDADRAMADYQRALLLDPALASALVNRAMLHYQAERYDAALDDLRLALERRAEPYLICYNRALVHLAKGDTAAAHASLLEALGHNPRHEEARQLADSLEP